MSSSPIEWFLRPFFTLGDEDQEFGKPGHVLLGLQNQKRKSGYVCREPLPSTSTAIEDADHFREYSEPSASISRKRRTSASKNLETSSFREGSRIPPFDIKPQAKQQNKNDLGWKQQNPADLLDVTGLNKYAQPTAGNTDTSVAPIDAADTQQDANSLIGRQSLGHLTASFAATPANFSPNSEEQSCPDTSTSKNTQEVDTKDNFLVNVEPAPTVVSSRRYSHLRWIDNMQARNSVTIALTAFYAMIVTIFALVFELSHLLTGENRRSVNSKDLMFGVFMYGVSIVFLQYCYIVLLLNPKWKMNLQKAKTFIVLKKNSNKMTSMETRKRTADCTGDNSIPSKLSAAEASQMKSAEANQLGDQLKQLETRIDQKLVNIDGSIQEMKAGFDAIKETVIISKGSRQGYLRASFNTHNLGKRCYSGNIRIAGSTCCFYVFRSTEDKKSISLAAYFECRLDSDALIYDANFTISLLGSISPHSLSKYSSFDREYSAAGWPSFILWSELIDKAKAFIDEGGNFTMQFEFLLNVRMNTQVPLSLDYSASNFIEPDCTLVVEGQKIPVCKALMMIHSSYFKAMFSREFREKNQDEIPLEGVLAVEFVHLMKVVYPSDDPVKDVNGQNVECLLRLADFFQMKIVTQRCAKYLKNYSNMKVKLEEKLLLAGTYSLSDLLDGCIAQYRTMDDLKRFVTCGQFSLFSSDIKVRVLENVSKVIVRST